MKLRDRFQGSLASAFGGRGIDREIGNVGAVEKFIRSLFTRLWRAVG